MRLPRVRFTGRGRRGAVVFLAVIMGSRIDPFPGERGI